MQAAATVQPTEDEKLDVYMNTQRSFTLHNILFTQVFVTFIWNIYELSNYQTYDHREQDLA